MSTSSGHPSQDQSSHAPPSPKPSDFHSAQQDDVASQVSRRSSASRSTRSSAESAILRARARAEAAKVNLQFAKREAELRQQTARQEAALLLLNAERDAAVAEAEASILEEEDGSRKSDNLNLPQEDHEDRVDHFVLNTCSNNGSDEVSFPRQTKVSEPEIRIVPNAPVVHNHPVPTLASPQPLDTVKVISEVSNILLKKELVTCGLRSFNDIAGNYRSWRASFKQSVMELKINASQEMDLLIKWLGKDSRQLVLPIHSIHVGRPELGLHRMWDLLDRRYGAPEAIEEDLQRRIDEFPKLSQRDGNKLLQFSHLLLEIQFLKEDSDCPGLLHLDSGRGLRPLVQKLPPGMQEKWLMHGAHYKEMHKVSFPPFKVFSEFVQFQAKVRNDPSLMLSLEGKPPDTYKKSISVKATDVKTAPQPKSGERCPIHKTNHSLQKCRVFLSKTPAQKKTIIMEHRLCFRCLFPNHTARECKANVKCDTCSSQRHLTIMHQEPGTESSGGSQQSSVESTQSNQPNITSACSRMLGSTCAAGKSCAKIVPVLVRSKKDRGVCVKTYAIIDDQSNKTIATHQLLDKFEINYREVSYTLRTCSGEETAHGRWADDFYVQDIRGTVSIDLPTVTECSVIPDFREDIPTPEVTRAYTHLKDVNIPELEPECTATLLIGRDVPEVHHVLEQRIGPPFSPFAQRLKLGWVVIGEVCLSGAHERSDKVVVTLRTQVLSSGRPTLLEPCPNEFQVKHLFVKEEDVLSPSVEETQFLDIMQKEGGLVGKVWTAPLPFRKPRERLPNNYTQAWKRAQILRNSMVRDLTKREHMLTFMEAVIAKGHAEVAPSLETEEECWYLPLFGVYHPRKKDKIRGVFDSSAEFQGTSLNKVLLKGPDLTNDLVGVLMRFRQGRVAVCADIESMFYCFSVSEKHRNFLRFFWHKDNDFDKPLIEYRMLKHVFGNTPSPAVANYGLRDLTKDADPDVKDFIFNDFYVDDGLRSCEDEDTAISLMKRTQAALKEKANIRLHKIASNSQAVLDAFDAGDVQKDIRNLTLSDGAPVPMQRSLGVLWNLGDDTFRFHTDLEEKPYTRRGVLSTINGVFDPLGFLAPVMIQARILFRSMTESKGNWDDPLPEEEKVAWETWKSRLAELQMVSVPRNYPTLPDQGMLRIFCDASEVAVAAAAYMVGTSDESKVGFVFGKSKLAPRSGHTIPRLELCAAVLGTEISKVVCRELRIQPSSVIYHTDSKIVLGYLKNTTRRFHTYVANRVHKVLDFSQPNQWRYVSTDKNPADSGTRPIASRGLKDSLWLKGPQSSAMGSAETSTAEFPLVNPEDDAEIRREETIQVIATKVELADIVSRVERFSTWSSLLRDFGVLVKAGRCFMARHDDIKYQANEVQIRREVKRKIIQMVQEKFYSREISCIQEGKPLPRGSSLLDLSPILNQDGLICVGGRLRKSSLPVVLKHPILIPGKSHIARFLVRHYHKVVGHPGRHLTEGAVREAGFWKNLL